VFATVLATAKRRDGRSDSLALPYCLGARVRRREFIILAGATALAAPRRVSAQSTARSYRLGWLGSTAASFKEPYSLAFVQRLSELGLTEGTNLTIERRHADSRPERLPELAAELAKLDCDVLFGSGLEASLAALVNSSRDTPIVFVAVDFDPVATGDVATLARPGGRVTGLTALQSELPAKRLELVRELLPGVGKVVVFTNEQTSAQLSLVQGTARRLGLPLHVVDFKHPPFDYAAGFADAVGAKADALFVLGSGLWVPARSQITEFALKARLPSVFHHSLWAEAGGLMSYGFNFIWMWRRGADMAANILRGAKPGDIPMEQPTTYELVINLKTAKALSLTIAPTLLARANEVIE
jgi:putative ABC transport system substrate-binding protein